MNLKEVGERLHAKRTELAEALKNHESMTVDQVEAARKLNAEVTDLSKQYDALTDAAKMREQNEREMKAAEQRQKEGRRLPTAADEARVAQTERKTLEQIIEGSQEYAAFRAGRTKTARINFDDALDFSELLGAKTLLTSSDWVVEPMRLPGIRASAQDETTVSDLMLSGTTSSSSITYMEETTFTNAAAETAEGDSKPEAALDFTERTDPVRKIPVWLPATTELLEDVPAMMSFIRGRLGFMVKQREEQQILKGDGTAPNISGILDRSGIQTQAKGADPTPDAVYKAMTKVRVTGQAEPTAAVFHPNDWQDIRLLRTADGVYIWGSPSEAGPERIWGLNVRITPMMTENTGLVGAFRPYAQVFRRKGLTITVSTEHSTYFTENKVAILAETRLALAVYRPSAFATITGI